MTLQADLTPDRWLTDVLALLEEVQDLKCCCTRPECRRCGAARLLAYYHQQIEPKGVMELIPHACPPEEELQGEPGFQPGCHEPGT